MSETVALRVTNERLLTIIDNREPRGEFFAFDRDEGIYVAVDNSTGDAFTEEFKTIRDACRWLGGEIDIWEEEIRS